MSGQAEHLSVWGRKSRVGMALVVCVLVGWLVADHPGIANAVKGRTVAKPAAGSILVIEHAVTDTVVQSGGTGDVTGNLLTFHNKVYDPTDTKQVGTDLGTCVRIAPAEGSWECNWTTFLADGQLNVDGPYYDTKNSVLAITGGTGAYRHAHGEMKLVSREGGKEYDFIFELS